MTREEYLSLEFGFQNAQLAHLLLSLDTCIGELEPRIDAQRRLIATLVGDARDTAQFYLDELVKARREFDRTRDSVKSRIARRGRSTILLET